jgi:hypothetical protein
VRTVGRGRTRFRTCFYSFDSWRRLVSRSGFALVNHYYRPPGKPRRQQPWLATLWRKSALPDQRSPG